MKKRFSEEQIIGFLREADAGLPIKVLCRRHGFSEASYYLWRGKFGGMNVSNARRLKVLEVENTKLDCFRPQPDGRSIQKADVQRAGSGARRLRRVALQPGVRPCADC